MKQVISSYLLVLAIQNVQVDKITSTAGYYGKMRDFEVALSSTPSVKQLNQTSCTVRLEAPLNNASLTQEALPGGQIKTRWRFSWQPCPGATKYQVYIMNVSALNPLINKNAITTTNYLYNHTGGPMTWLNGWTWKVRAYVGGRWQAWSETRTFDITPLPCSISGYVRGGLTYEASSDVGDERYTLTLKTIFLTTPDKVVVQKATLQNRFYVFQNVQPNQTYRIYVESAFISDPEYIEISHSCSGGRHIHKNFEIKGIKPAG